MGVCFFLQLLNFWATFMVSPFNLLPYLPSALTIKLHCKISRHLYHNAQILKIYFPPPRFLFRSAPPPECFLFVMHQIIIFFFTTVNSELVGTWKASSTWLCASELSTLMPNPQQPMWHYSRVTACTWAGVVMASSWGPSNLPGHR